MPSHIDKEKTRKKISLMLEKMKTEADPQLLNEYRVLFKKEVSVFRRSWTAAYLLMLLDQGQGNAGRFDRSRDRYAERGGRNSGEKSSSGSGSGNSRQENPRPEASRSEPPRRPLPEEESRRLFISIGRNRRVFPREILGLINSKAEISRDDVGAIRIMDNYSFVQVRSSVADKIIEALNGKPFRGRLLTVNYARARKENSEEDRDTQPSPTGEGSPLDEDSLIADGGANGGLASADAEDTPADTVEYGEDRIKDEAENEAADDSLDHGDDQGNKEGV